MATNQNRVVYVGNPNQHIMNQQANSMATCCSVGLIMFGVFLCFPGITVTATGASYIAGPIILCIGITLLVIGVSMCVKNRKNMAAGFGGTTITTTTVQQQPYVVQQGNTRQNVTMQTNVHPTTTVYQAGPAQTTMYHQQTGAPVGAPGPQAPPTAFSPPNAGPGYPPANPAYPPPNPAAYSPANPAYPPTAPGYQPPSSQASPAAPPSYNDVVKSEIK